MATNNRRPRYPREEFARRADIQYRAHVEPNLKPRDKGKYVAIDIESGEYEMDREQLAAIQRLWDRLADPQPFMFRVGYPAVIKFGGWKHRKTK